MSYNIYQKNVIDFITDPEIKLPRFQRKATWKPGQSFELIISMAKEYPMGVVVINREQGTSWLLDGRQRLNALRVFRNNPNEMYEAAKSYIKFNDRTTDDELKDMFWKKVEAYLINITPNTSANSFESDEAETTDADSEMSNEEMFEAGIDRDRQQEGLKTLLDVIRMVHVRKKVSGNKYGTWERLFKLDEYLSNLPYQLKKDGYVINPIQLRKFLLELGIGAEAKRAAVSPEYLLEIFEENVKEGKEQSFKDYISHNWQEMANVVDAVVRSESIFRRAMIGAIMIQNVTPLDAQNIFSKINTGGSPLTPEELNSAKPFWNEIMNGYSPEVDGWVRKLYERLNISTDGKVVKWDLPATLMHRIHDYNIIFENYSCDDNAKKEDSFPEVGIGFKLIAAYFTKGISKVKINSLENCKDISWPKTIDAFVDDFNRMCNALKEDDLFNRLTLWRRPLIKLVGESAAFEFCSIMLDEWKRLGEPQVAGANRNKFHRNARILFDNLVYEYATGFWRGTGDNKMSTHVKNPEKRFTQVTTDKWQEFIAELCSSGTFNGSPVSKVNILPLIYYQFVLRGIQHPMDAKEYEVDHTIAQALIKGHPNVPDWFMDSLVNLSILPQWDNNAKKDRRLSSLKGSVLGNVVSKFIGIDESEFDKYSDVANLQSFIEERKKLLIETFTTRRQSMIDK